MKKLLAFTVLLFVMASGSVKIGALSVPTITTTTNVSEPTSCIRELDASTTGTAIWCVTDEDKENNTITYVLQHNHDDTTFLTSISVTVYSSDDLGTQLAYKSTNVNMASLSKPSYHQVVITGIDLDNEYTIRLATNNPSTTPLYTNTLYDDIVLYENPSLISQVTSSISDMVVGFISIMVALFSNTGTVAIFYSSENGLTILGSLLVLVFGLGMVRWAFNLIKGLVSFK